MSLTVGTKLGNYEVLSLLGKGGMGEVYRARDTRLGRDVALKVLPDVFAHDPDRLSRFQREAQVLASLNHSNIAQIYGLEESGPSARSAGSGSTVSSVEPSTGSGQAAVRAIVMELVEGETLQDRVRHGPLPLGDALAIAKQIAEALATAHDKHVIHRDLKPANVKITPDGHVKVLDFGLAKALESAPPREGLSHSPTLSVAATEGGLILGTAAYMSPEQAKGQPADARSDIWAFGVVLYEMLAGQTAFSGETIVEILGGIMKVDPDWGALPAATPATIRSLLRRCLQKDPKRRMKDIVDASIELDEALGEAAKSTVTTRALPVAPASKGRERLAWIVAAVLLLVTAPLGIVHFREPAPDTRPTRFVLLAPEKATVLGTPPAISPDGRRVAFTAILEGKTQIWIRPLESLTAQPLPGTDGAEYLFWSPDGRFIAFFAGGKLRRIDASGGPPQTLCDAPLGRGGTWNRDGAIVFTPTTTGPLHRVSASGGASTPVTTTDASTGETSHRWPSFLPDGRHFLFFVQGGERQGIYVGSLENTDRRLLLNAASAGAYAHPGYVLFVKERSLMAQPLDLGNLQQAGEAFPIAEPVGFTVDGRLGNFSVSDNGVLVYGTGTSGDRQLVWFDRTGKPIERIGPPMAFFDVALAPDQKRAAIQGPLSPNQDILVVDLVRGVPSRFTFHDAAEDFPVWSPDGSHLLFNSVRDGGTNIYQKASSGAGNEEPLVKSSTAKIPTDLSRDGRFILYEELDPKNRSDLWVKPLVGDAKPQPFWRTPFNERSARFSSDGKWVAYVSDESGRDEVYVQSFPPSGGKWQVSTTGGFTPRWRRDGKELFFIAPDRKMMSVEVAGATTFDVSLPKALFEAPVDSPAGTNRYDVSPDGQRFLINAPAENTSASSMTVVLNWLADVKNKP